ncbi:MAG: amidohydrolase family protein, partial [Cyclobacteriaceae bacterium]|nr:amidohydrolase family protein [Cyclobacteriaceae bacterium]
NESVLEAIDRSIKWGAVGVKVWKNIGMQLQKESGDFLMINDPVFYPIFEYLIEKKVSLLAHIGEPKNCWLPLEQMTTKRNRDYYIKNPEFHMYHHPEYPSYESLIDGRDNVLKKFPSLIFIGAHLGSLEWSINELAKRFDMFPDFVVDLSSRLNHLQLQAISNYTDIRNFFIKYADRLIYGSDIVDNFSLSRSALVDKIENAYHNDWLFLSTDKMITSNEFDGQFKGLNLPLDILKLIYYNNALNNYPLLKKKLCMI